MRYKVYDTIIKRYVTNDSNFILKPNGRLAINDDGDEIGIPYCIPLFYPTESDDYYIDEIGGVHNSIDGCMPNGKICDKCINVSCSLCYVWKERK